MIYTNPYTGKNEYKHDIFDDFPVGLGKNSWFLKKPLSECTNLFQACDTDMVAYAYICKCGHEIINPPQERNYRCPECDNIRFYDVSSFNQRNNVFLANVDMEPEFYLDETIATIKLFVNIPKSIDLARNKVIFKKEKVYEKNISLLDARESVDTSDISNDVKEYAHHRLLDFIAKNYLKKKLIGYDQYFLDKTYPQLRKGVRFFLEHSDFKHAEFIKWSPMDEDLYHEGGVVGSKTPEKFLEYVRAYRTERSVKRTLYKRYMSEISVGTFDVVTPYVICRNFKDPNHICTLLESDLTFSYRMSESVRGSAASYTQFIEFLLHFYSEKQMVRILQSIKGDNWLWTDSVRMLNIFEIERISNIFRPSKANIKEIHDRLVYARDLAEANCISVKYEFSEDIKKPCGVWHKKYEIVLPEDSNELVSWSKTLKNCLYSYVADVYEGNTSIYGVKMKGELLYAIEVQNYALIQMKGKYNADPSKEVQSSLHSWHQYFFITPWEKGLLEVEENQ